MIDYSQVLDIINASDNPATALAAFVAQERERAAHEAREVAYAQLGVRPGSPEAANSAMRARRA